MTRPAFRTVLRAATPHLIVLAGYLLLSAVVLWPLPLVFRSEIIGQGDARHLLWTLWNAKEALAGSGDFLFAGNLYYPAGISLLVHALGPLYGVAVAPFWFLGPAAVYNSALLLGFTFTGYCMYLLARNLGLGRPESFFAGVLLVMAPLHLSAAYGHLTKAFLGLLPLALLTVRNALDRERSRWWIPASGAVFLAALLYSGEQFVFAAFGVAGLTLYAIAAAPAAERALTLRRAVVVAATVAIFTLPLLIAIQRASSHPNIAVALNRQSLQLQPDLYHFFAPADFGLSAFFAEINQISAHGLETFVFLPWTALLLASIALATTTRRVLPWAVLTGAFVVLAMGPQLSIGRETLFTDYELPIVLPYAFLSSLPGLDFMRTPGRFMEIGYVMLAVTAAFGLAWLGKRRSRTLRLVLIGAATLLIIGENAPITPWPRDRLPAAPAFYQEIAQDPAEYGVFDLPIKPNPEATFGNWHLYFSSYYQMLQMTHGKGIHSGYLSRFYKVHPVFGQFISENATQDSPLREDIRIDGAPSNVYANLEYELARHGYRYVVVHKPRADMPEYQPGAWGYTAAQTLVDNVFTGRTPLVDDELVTVYRVNPITDTRTLRLNMALLEQSAVQSRRQPSDQRWALSPATFLVTAPQAQMAMLDVRVGEMREQESDHTHDYALLVAESGDGRVVATAPLAVNETSSLPLALAPGSQVITLTVHSLGDAEAGKAGQPLNFAIDALNLHSRNYGYPCDISIDGGRQRCDGADVEATPFADFGAGWYDSEEDPAATWRWAASPAEVWYYGEAGGAAELAFTPVALHDPAGADGKGAQGQFLLSVNGGPAVTVAATVGVPAQVQLTLQPGWNRIQFSLAAGNFKPVDFQPETGDTRTLSFALSDLSFSAR